MYKVGWMIGIAVAPEIGVAIAMYQYLWARAGLKELRVDMPRETGSRHVELRKTESRNLESKGTEPKDVESKHAQVTVLGVGRDEITMAHTFFANMGGFIAEVRVLSPPEQGKTPLNKLDETSPVPKTSHEFIGMIDDCRNLS
jgi:hypothetical protein